MIKALIFDWGDTVMRDFPEFETPMFLWDRVELIQGVEIALNRLSKKYIMVIATNAGQSDTISMIKALERVEVKKYFNFFFSSKDLGYAKPDIRFFKAICENISVKADECLMIGNLYQKDIIGAKNAGMKTILFNEKQIAAEYPEADYVINTMEKLFETIENADNISSF